MTTSARPDHLDRFVARSAMRRHAVADVHHRVANLTGQVRRNSIDFDVDAPSIVAFSDLVADMEATETFVSTVRDALLAADADHVGGAGGSAVSIDDALIAPALHGIGASRDPIAFEAATMVGLPVTSGFVDDPICAATGNMIHQDLDVDHPGLASALDLTRTYNSVVGDRPGVFGPGWSSVLDCSLIATDDRVEVRLPDGATAAWVGTPSGWGSAGRRLHDVTTSDDGWEVATDPQHALRFDAEGVLVGWIAGPAAVDVVRVDGRVTTLTERRSGRSVAIEWHERGGALRIAGLTTGDGRTVTFRHDGVGRLVAATGPGGATRTYEWADGRLRSVADADGVRPFVNDYDERGRVVRQVSPFGRVTRYRYDDHGLTVVTDDAGTRQAMVHDPRGNLTAVIDTDGSAMRLTYDHADRIVGVTDRDGATWHYTYDSASGRLAERRDPDGLRSEWTWDPRGRLRTHTDRAGAATFFDYPSVDGPAGRAVTTPTRVTDAVGESIDIDVDVELDRPVTITDADGVTIRLEHDGDGQPVAVVDGLGARTELHRDAAGRVARIVDPLGVSTTIERDHAGRVVGHRRAGIGGRVTRTPGGRIEAVMTASETTSDGCVDRPISRAQLGTHGAPVAIIDAAGHATRFDHDAMGNIVAVTTADGATFHQFFDQVGRLIGTADPTGATSHLHHDRAGRVVELVDPDGRIWRRDVDLLGRTIRSYDPGGAITSTDYHPCGAVARVVLANGDRWSTEVDHAGRVIAVVEPDGDRHERVYSAAGRLVALRTPDGRTELLDYDAAGRLAGSVDRDGVRHTIDRDAAGRLVRAGDDRGSSVHLDRDAHGRLIGRRTPIRADHFELDAAGRLLARTDGTGARRTFEWEARGLLAAATDPAGVTIRYDHDACGRLIAQTAGRQDATRFDYDPAGRLATMTDAVGVITTFEHDLAGRLVGQRRGDAGWRATFDPSGRVVALHDLAGLRLGGFEYDLAGVPLRDSSPVAVSTRSTAVDRPDPPERRAVARDAAGRVLRTRDGHAFRYDDAGRLAAVALPDGSETCYEYDEHGLVAVERSARGTRRFRYDAGGRVVAVTGDAGTTRYQYDDAGRRSVEVRPDGSRCELRWRGIDRLTGVTTVDRGGAVSSIAIDHDPVGRAVLVDGEPAGDDVTIGSLSLLGVRVLDVATGQFLSPDPLLPFPGSTGGASPYSHAWLDQVNHVDPTGARPISRDEWERIRTREERGAFGAAVAAVPWDVVAAVGVVAVGVGLTFVPGGQLVGAGILLGAVSGGATALIMGDLDPLDIALGGIVGGACGGVGLAVQGGVSVGRAALANGVIGVAGDAAQARRDGAPYGLTDAATSLVLSGAAARFGWALDGIDTIATPLRRAGVDAAAEGSASVVDQIVRTGTVDVRTTVAAAGGGLPSGYAGGYVDLAGVETRIDRTLPIVPGSEPHGHDRTPTSAVEAELLAESGLLLGDQAPPTDDLHTDHRPLAPDE